MRIIRPLVVGLVVAGAVWVLFARGNPGGISDAKYAQFKAMAPPKVLYSCIRRPPRETFRQEEKACLKTGRSACDDQVNALIEAGTQTTVDFLAGSGSTTYDELLRNATRECAGAAGTMGPGEFVVLEADRT